MNSMKPTRINKAQVGGRRHRARPNLIEWIAYAMGRKLPDSMQDWVRNDLVGDRAIPRHLVRSMVPFVPVFVVFLLFPGQLWLRGAMVLLGVLLALFYSVSYMAQNRSRRLEKNGLPADLMNEKREARFNKERMAYEKMYGTGNNTDI